VVQSSITSLAGVNVVLTIAEQPAFTGLRSPGVLIRGGSLQLGSVATLVDWPALAHVGAIGDFGPVAVSGEYAFADQVDLSEVYISRITSRLAFFGFQTTNILGSWPVLAQLGPLSGSDPDASSAVLQVRTTPDDPADVAAVWSVWSDFIVGDYTARGLEFRVIFSSFAAGVSVRASEVSVEIDMPDRVEGGEDVICPPGGVYITFAPAFKARPAISADGQELTTGARSIRTNVTRAGFHQKYVDAAGVDLSCSFDWVAKGYGRAQ
jgi:hypothetical protein